ncbi:(2Fe-2S)-binding protein [Sphingosinicella soli]|uniref:Aerobic-type carbon monoxide dehydrogenase small subunit (CoxS/CutS family) n=1 Tax=Sphingosinicella soli TaxID=333708 RepID=A0A7W7F7M0_9SPHN|nr:(2Fe-2S)-binding protein [Sphingosinicella soli]MBB4633815.1 aerobic-type carbon monoxide dehydrogenase small subunit (CoxS/CutS family) [Sphingosinicella soli]
MSVPIACAVNGRDVAANVPATARLSDFLRDTLGLKGTHVACGDGVCGNCTVIVDGEAVRSCLTLAAQCDGRAIETVEGVAEADVFPAIRAAFLRHNALQCGYCTPGFVTTIAAMMRDNAREALTDAEIGSRISSVACRCTGYVSIVAAARALLGRSE